MKKVNFYLNEQIKGAKKTIYLNIREGKNNSFRKSLNFAVLPSDWNKQKQRVRDKANILDKDIINNYLNDIENALQHFFNELTAKNEKITLEKVRIFFANWQNPQEKKNYNVLSFAKEYYLKSKKRINSKTGEGLTKGTINKFKILCDLLQEYEQKNKINLNFNDINLNFYNEFVLFLQQKEYASNTIGKYIRTLKTILNDSIIQGINTNKAFLNSNFKVIREDVFNIYLNNEELQKIEHVCLNNSELENIRFLFLIGCYTGLRFSDFIRIREENIQNNLIKIIQNKTKELVVIPLHRYIKENLHKIKEIKIVSNKTLNEKIKIICEKAEIKTKVLKEQNKGGKRIREYFEKWQLVSSHTARRSFASNSYLDGVPTLTIMKITGHKSEKAFLKYIKISEEENAKILEKYWGNNE